MLYILQWLFPYWKKYRVRMFIIILLGILSAVLHAVNPILIKNIINGLTYSLTRKYITQNVALIFGVGLSISLVNIFAQRNRAWMNMRLEWEFRKRVFSHLVDMDRNFYCRYTTGDLVTRLIDDISNKISWFSCSGVFRFLQSFFTLTAVIGTMFYLNIALTLWVMIPVPVLIFSAIKLGRKLSKKYEELQKSISLIFDFLETCFTGIKVIKANAKEKPQLDFFSERAVGQKNAEISAARLDIIFGYFYHSAAFVSITILLIVGGKMVIDGKTTLGELVAFQFYASMIIMPLMDISNFFISGNRAGASIKRLDELLHSRTSLEAKLKSLHADGRIEEVTFKNVSFKLPNSDKLALKDISFRAEKGQRTAVVGKIGSGKSTLLSMIARLAEFTSGELLFNREDARNFDLKNLRSRIGLVPQDSFIFSDTIINNITLERENVSAEALEKALEVSQLKKDLDKFPKKLNTFVGTRGFSISGGQKQRICVARALLTGPDILLLDDATSAMDAETENDFWRDFKLNFSDSICIIVTHRNKTIENSDKILVMDSGNLAEEGTHPELMKLNGLYKQIYERQKLEEELQSGTG
ncbi:MAG: ABC transporter ATP-binding protein [Elusimicrobia bacterium]|nr:ABC transporter ATP-binding protein [Elusimicrobiota bacterium]